MSQPAPRVPEFLALARHRWEVAAAAFPSIPVGMHDGSPPSSIAITMNGGARPAAAAPAAPAAGDSGPARTDGGGAAAAPAPAVFPQVDPRAVANLERKLAETSSRVGLAVERLRSTTERVAAEARADALEVALLVARRVLETELTQNLDAQVAFIRSAIRRLGESRVITVRLHPEQAKAMKTDEAEGIPSGSGTALPSLTSAKLEVVGDPALAAGDCVVEGDLASIDGRLGTRLDEVRRAVLAALGEEEAA